MKIQKGQIKLETTTLREGDIGWDLTIDTKEKDSWVKVHWPVSDEELSDLIYVLNKWKTINPKLVELYLKRRKNE